MKKLHVALVLVVVLALPLLQVPKAYSTEWSAPDKALSFLEDVVNLDMTKYNTTLDGHFVDYRSDLGGITQEDVMYTLESDGSKLVAALAFINKTLDWCILDVLEGSPLFAPPPPTNVIDNAKVFLQRYQTYTGASYLQVMRDMLDTVDEIENMTTTVGNVTLEMSSQGDIIFFEWLFTLNGFTMREKKVEVVFRNGVFESFMDNYDLFTFGNIDVNVSGEEAIAIARQHVKNFSWKVSMGGDDWIEVTEFNVVDEPMEVDVWMYPREENSTVLYPHYHINLYLDAVYPGNVNRIAVGIWADTGEIIYCQALGMGGGDLLPEDPTNEPPTEPPPDDSTDQTNPDPTPILIAVPIVLAIILGSVVYFRKIKKTTGETNEHSR